MIAGSFVTLPRMVSVGMFVIHSPSDASGAGPQYPDFPAPHPLHLRAD